MTKVPSDLNGDREIKSTSSPIMRIGAGLSAIFYLHFSQLFIKKPLHLFLLRKFQLVLGDKELIVHAS